MLSYDMRTWMPDNLMMKADKILMAHSLEGRFPFLDRELFEFTARLPQRLKLHPDGTQKWILKTAIAPFLPEKILSRPKMGFSVPLPEILGGMRGRFNDALQSARGGALNAVLDLDAIAGLGEAFCNGNKGLALQVWTLFVLLHWFHEVLPSYRSRALRDLPASSTRKRETRSPVFS